MSIGIEGEYPTKSVCPLCGTSVDVIEGALDDHLVSKIQLDKFERYQVKVSYLCPSESVVVGRWESIPRG